MDLSKLPKLSQTSRHAQAQHPPALSAAPAGYVPSRRNEECGDRALGFIDIFLAIGMGLLFIFLGMNYGKHLFGSTTAFPEITSTGYVWREPHPRAGQPILPDELTPTNREAYNNRILSRRLGIVSESSLFLLGAGLAIAGLVGIVGHLGFVNLALRRIAAIVGVLVTLLATGYALWAVVVMMQHGQMPAMTMVAILVAGLSIFMQVAAVRSLSAPRYADPAADPPSTSASYGQRSAAAGTAIPIAASVSAPERIVHHRFAHQTLRKAVFADPSTVIGMLQGAGGAKYLRDLWHATCDTAGADPTQVSSVGLESEITQVGPYSAAIVTLPPAKERGEAAFVGLVLRSYIRQDGAVIERSPLVLYYALELDTPELQSTDSSKAVICEWQAGDHVKFADRLPIDFRRFREAMWSKVQARQEAEDRAATSYSN